MPTVYDVIGKIKSKNLTDTGYSIAKKNEIISVINDFKGLVTDTAAISIMNNIVVDVTYYANKPISVLKTDLNY
ncbi:MAG: hypothetical protein H7Y86_06755 [Rhizobacter sp.]|nr:hypothetical protein [Ferruginibacter sp.]